ncbi:M48 family metalloprotease [Novosphingobium sp. Chol11]|uniref:M48 family metalloprotease n=1 Tax=Novosphingobium sp. Chol11 TaxID=1385763 RepID=UPI0025E8F495|nr:M48 family metalloprotease [Novosphingobium sp. Chol11]
MRSTRRARADGRRLAAVLALASLALANLALPAAAQPIDQLQRDDEAVQSLGWRLSHGNAAFCARAAPGIGLLLADAQTFDDPARARQAYGLSGDIAVAAVAADGPAARAGLAANATVGAIEGAPVKSLMPPPRNDSWARVLGLQQRIERALAQSGVVSLTLADDRVIAVRGAPACAVRFIVDDGKGNAAASRDQVRIGRETLRKLGDDPAMIAAVLAHELAHAALDHESLITGVRNRRAVTQRCEREADRLSVWILANAGFDPAAAAAMNERLAAGTLALIASSTHGSTRARLARIRAEIAQMAAAPDHDWAKHFRREDTAPAEPAR